MRILPLCLFAFMASLLAGCGFKPVYATGENGVYDELSNISIGAIAAPQDLLPKMRAELEAVFPSANASGTDYTVYVETRERAQRLAVQIDATVTRYNYRLNGRYTVVENSTGAQFRASSQVVTSYNIVQSQYSTLFAENTAIKKAAKLLAEEIRRDIAMKLLEGDKAFNKKASRRSEDIIEFDENLFEPRRDTSTTQPFSIEPIVPEDETAEPAQSDDGA